MIAILIGAGVSGVVLGAASRMIFLLPAALMALMVAAVLILRAVSDKAGAHAKLDFPKFFATVASNNAMLVSAIFSQDQFASYLKGL